MSLSGLIISPKTRVGELLDAYPDLEPVLMSMSPAFEKLKNPVLRKTVARVATLQQVAVVGGLNIEEMVKYLRKEVGQNDEVSDFQTSEYQTAESPDWFDQSRIVGRFNATPIINSGESPMNEILHLTNNLKSGEIFELQTPFIPAPIIDMLRTKNFKIHTINAENHVISYISK